MECSNDRPKAGLNVSAAPGGAAEGTGAVERPRLFEGIPPEHYARICAAGYARNFDRGEIIYCEGDSVPQVLLLTSGFVKINKFGLGGAEVILRLAVPGDVLGALGLFSTGTHCTSAQAFRPCRALIWDADAFQAMVQRFPILHLNTARIITGYLLELEQRFREVATEKVGMRVARQVVRLSEQIGRKVQGEVEIGLSREELAQMTGTTLFTVSRLFSAWEARGLVRPRREAVIVRDVQSLRAISE